MGSDAGRARGGAHTQLPTRLSERAVKICCSAPRPSSIPYRSTERWPAPTDGRGWEAEGPGSACARSADRRHGSCSRFAAVHTQSEGLRRGCRLARDRAPRAVAVRVASRGCQRQSTETTWTGSSKPFSVSARGSESLNAAPAPSSVSRLTRISPAPAAAPIRAAVCTPWPA